MLSSSQLPAPAPPPPKVDPSDHLEVALRDVKATVIAEYHVFMEVAEAAQELVLAITQDLDGARGWLGAV